MRLKLTSLLLALLLWPVLAAADPAEDFEAGMEALKARKHELAIEKLTAALASGQLNEKATAAAYLARGTAKRFMGKPGEAAPDFAAVTALDPDNADAWLYLGDAKLQAGDIEGALENLDQAVALAPENGFAVMIRGDARYAAANYVGARDDYGKAVVLAPDLAAAFLGRARTLEKLEEPELALEDYKVALELDPRLESAKAAIDRIEKAETTTED